MTDPEMVAAFPKSKRVFDLAVVFLSAPVTLPIALIISGLILLFDGRPVLHVTRRSGQGGRGFALLKFRTMRESGRRGDIRGDSETIHQVSGLGQMLRRSRLDELPQLINVLRAEMSLVGPRPPAPRYVAAYPDIYAAVLRDRPGLTGLATLYMHRFEARILSVHASLDAVDRVYRRRAIPRKARLDLIYQARQSRPGAVCFDALILFRTVRSLFR